MILNDSVPEVETDKFFEIMASVWDVLNILNERTTDSQEAMLVKLSNEFYTEIFGRMGLSEQDVIDGRVNLVDGGKGLFCLLTTMLVIFSMLDQRPMRYFLESCLEHIDNLETLSDIIMLSLRGALARQQTDTVVH